MIKNEREYHITKREARKFEDAIAGLPDPAMIQDENNRLFEQLQADALRSQLDDLHAQLLAYEHLRAGERRIVPIGSMLQLAEALIAARIAAGLTQRELAERLGMKEQQIQRYEATDYESASLARIAEIADALGIQITGTIALPGRGSRAA
jgi:DNA-binding XRE family transcriptional regulator